MKFRETADGREFEVELIERFASSAQVRIDGREILAACAPTAGGGYVLTIDGRSIRVAAARIGERTFVAAGCASFEFVPAIGERVARGRALVTPEVIAPMPGKVLKVMVAEGDLVTAGQPLIVLEAMKMETTLNAESAAVVRRVAVAPGAMVDDGAVLIELNPAPGQSSPEAADRES